MQTFLPYADFEQSAKVLDYRRLGKQRVEAYQILNALDGKTKGWVNHPATKMWRGYDMALTLYAVNITQEWRNRGYLDGMLDMFLERLENYASPIVWPYWLGDSEFHASHQSNLLAKDPIHYGKYFSNVPDNLPYVWPTAITELERI